MQKIEPRVFDYGEVSDCGLMKLGALGLTRQRDSVLAMRDAGRLKGAFTDKPRGSSGGRRSLLVDALAERGEEEEALCAVCAGGHSEAPDQIVFCERCDIAVHQECYGVPTIPSGPIPHLTHDSWRQSVWHTACMLLPHWVGADWGGGGNDLLDAG